MPFVLIRYAPYHKRGIIEDKLLGPLTRSLPQVIADSLSCNDPGGECLPEYVDIKIEEISSKDITGGHILQILIDANDYPSRRKNLEKRNKKIANGVNKILGAWKMPFYVWTRLMPAAFVEKN